MSLTGFFCAKSGNIILNNKDITKLKTNTLTGDLFFNA